MPETGRGVDPPAADPAVQLDGAELLGERAAVTGGSRAGTVSVGGGCRLLPTADGLVAVSEYRYCRRCCELESRPATRTGHGGGEPR